METWIVLGGFVVLIAAAIVLAVWASVRLLRRGHEPLAVRVAVWLPLNALPAVGLWLLAGYLGRSAGAIDIDVYDFLSGALRNGTIFAMVLFIAVVAVSVIAGQRVIAGQKPECEDTPVPQPARPGKRRDREAT